jgi:hypothetical protein
VEQLIDWFDYRVNPFEAVAAAASPAAEAVPDDSDIFERTPPAAPAPEPPQTEVKYQM